MKQAARETSYGSDSESEGDNESLLEPSLFSLEGSAVYPCSVDAGWALYKSHERFYLATLKVCLEGLKHRGFETLRGFEISRIWNIEGLQLCEGLKFLGFATLRGFKISRVWNIEGLQLYEGLKHREFATLLGFEISSVLNIEGSQLCEGLKFRGFETSRVCNFARVWNFEGL